MVITIAGLSGYYISATSSRPNSSTVSLSSACSAASTITNYVFNSPPPSKQVLLLQPGSTVEICVTYDTNWSNSTDFAHYESNYFSSGNLAIPFKIYNDITARNGTTQTTVVGPAKNGTQTVTTITSGPSWALTSKPYSGSFVASMTPPSITPSLTMASFTVLYTISPRSNSTGFYSDFVPAPGLLISVGHTAAEIKASDFPYAGVVKPGGPPFPYQPVNVSVIGANVVDLSVPLGWPYGGPTQ